jgi:pyruvate kinase
MLSGETAIGHDPVGAIRTMATITFRAEQDFNYERWGSELEAQKIAETRGAAAQLRITAALSAAGWRAVTDAQAVAIVACTNTGATARAISRFRPTVPVLAATPSPRTARQLAAAWGITPVVVDERDTTDDLVWFAVKAAVKLGLAKTNDVVAVLAGSPDDPEPATDVLRLVRIR